MLIYHPGSDAYHCVFRLLIVAEKIRDLEIDMLRLLDFYLLYPAAISKIRLPAQMMKMRKEANAVANIFHEPMSIKTSFRDLAHIQDAALRCVAASGLIDLERYEAGYVTRTDLELPEELKVRIDAYIARGKPINEFILGELSEYPLRGPNGLKHRTELLEYRYDVI